ncbi:hypothetical protein TSACC_21681 [Terrimicrobium sacchariphilum]|uniref:Uncharacterized protein n=1 Tax=Terrimicrobium sacchariphilum TaxID=690879 RepID=A0A146G9C7_TERSA|nr:hypothetical protein [Terrimicrobium sacchariphilum]GAT33268.1 hypothetical protein TSACC_21681 [Terrimicrobium sacchariphilum]
MSTAITLTTTELESYRTFFIGRTDIDGLLIIRGIDAELYERNATRSEQEKMEEEIRRNREFNQMKERLAEANERLEEISDLANKV